MRTGNVLVLLCICFTYSTIISQNHILGKDSLELSFYPISGLENYHSENDCKITGSAWVDSLSVKINLFVKDNNLKLDKPYKNGDYFEIIFAVPEIDDSGNCYIATQRSGNFVYQYNHSNNLEKFKKEWRNPLIKFDDERITLRYDKIKGTDSDCLMDEVLDPDKKDKPFLKYIPYGITHFIVYPKADEISNANKERFIEREIESGNRDIRDITKYVNKQTSIKSDSLILTISIPLNGFAYLSKKLASEIRFLIKFHDVDSSNTQSTIFSNCFVENEFIYSKFQKLYPQRPFMDSSTFALIIPDIFNSNSSPIFLNTLDDWLPIEKFSNNLNTTRSTCHWYTPNLQMMLFGIGTSERRNEIFNNLKFDIYSVMDFTTPNFSKDYVIINDSLILVVDNFVNPILLNSGKYAFVISEEKYVFGECRETQFCGCGTYEEFYILTYQDLKTFQDNKIRICSQNHCIDDNLFFYPEVIIENMDYEQSDSFNFNNFKDNTLTMKFSNKRVVKIKVDEEKWRLIFIKNW